MGGSVRSVKCDQFPVLGSPVAFGHRQAVERFDKVRFALRVLPENEIDIPKSLQHQRFVIAVMAKAYSVHKH
ncbi:hypothetical protein D3C73_1631720 [compost metagenome]